MTAIATPSPSPEADLLTRNLLRDLHQPNPRIFWTDLFATALAGWTAFALAVAFPLFSLPMLAAAFVAMLALYRGLCFVHEISHMNAKSLRGFQPVWDALFGFPLLMPSFVYCGVHQYHHKLTTYGTKQDPEYLPFASSAVMTSVFAIQSFLVPVLLMLRFLVLTPIGFVFANFEKWLMVHASSLTMNVAYRRQMSDQLVRTVRIHSLIIWFAWASLAVATAAGLLPSRFWLVWLMVSGLASFVNTIRTLGAHAYESTGEPMSRTEQLLDSIDTPGAFWTELWAPVGLRYHALHHYFPGIPYHNLPEAYARLKSELEPAADYHRSWSASLPHSLAKLLRKGIAALR